MSNNCSHNYIHKISVILPFNELESDQWMEGRCRFKLSAQKDFPTHIKVELMNEKEISIFKKQEVHWPNLENVNLKKRIKLFTKEKYRPYLQVRLAGHEPLAVFIIYKEEEEQIDRYLKILNKIFNANSKQPKQIGQLGQVERHVEWAQRRGECAYRIFTEVMRCSRDNPDNSGASSVAATILAKARYRFTEQQFQRVCLPYADLSGSDCSRADFSNAKLNHANFSNSVLQGASFVDADLREASLSGAQAKGADFTRANLCKANCESAHLQQAKVKEANLDAANFKKANLTDIVLDKKPHLSHSRNVKDCIFFPPNRLITHTCDQDQVSTIHIWNLDDYQKERQITPDNFRQEGLSPVVSALGYLANLLVLYHAESRLLTLWDIRSLKCKGFKKLPYPLIQLLSSTNGQLIVTVSQKKENIYRCDQWRIEVKRASTKLKRNHRKTIKHSQVYCFSSDLQQFAYLERMGKIAVNSFGSFTSLFEKKTEIIGASQLCFSHDQECLFVVRGTQVIKWKTGERSTNVIFHNPFSIKRICVISEKYLLIQQKNNFIVWDLKTNANFRSVSMRTKSLCYINSRDEQLFIGYMKKVITLDIHSLSTRFHRSLTFSPKEESIIFIHQIGSQADSHPYSICHYSLNSGKVTEQLLSLNLNKQHHYDSLSYDARYEYIYAEHQFRKRINPSNSKPQPRKRSFSEISSSASSSHISEESKKENKGKEEEIEIDTKYFTVWNRQGNVLLEIENYLNHNFSFDGCHLALILTENRLQIKDMKSNIKLIYPLDTIFDRDDLRVYDSSSPTHVLFLQQYLILANGRWIALCEWGEQHDSYTVTPFMWWQEDDPILGIQCARLATEPHFFFITQKKCCQVKIEEQDLRSSVPLAFISNFAVSEDGRFTALFSRDGCCLSLLDTASWNTLDTVYFGAKLSYSYDPTAVRKIQISPDNRFLAIFGQEEDMIWEISEAGKLSPRSYIPWWQLNCNLADITGATLSLTDQFVFEQLGAIS